MKYFKECFFIAIIISIISCGVKNKQDKLQLSNVSDLKREVDIDKSAIDESKGIFNGFTDSTKSPTPPQKTGPFQKQQQSESAVTNPDWDKKIIKTASLNLEVEDYNKFYSFMREKVRNLGGYIAQEEQNQSDYKIENTLSIKVPVDQFDNALGQLTSSNIKKINEKKITSQDVTTEFIDTKSRMESKKQVRLRYLDLLKQAKNMEEILSVQTEINGIQEDIESAAGRIEYLGHSASYSTIDLTYYQILNSSAKDDDKPSFATKMSSAFKNGWSWIGDLFIGLLSIWPLLLVVFAAILFYKRTRVTKTKEA